MLFAIVIGSCSIWFSRYFCHVLYETKLSMATLVIKNIDRFDYFYDKKLYLDCFLPLIAGISVDLFGVTFIFIISIF